MSRPSNSPQLLLRKSLATHKYSSQNKKYNENPTKERKEERITGNLRLLHGSSRHKVFSACFRVFYITFQGLRRPWSIRNRGPTFQDKIPKQQDLVSHTRSVTTSHDWSVETFHQLALQSPRSFQINPFCFLLSSML